MIYIKFMSQKQFGGMSGDITGFLISICEISGLLGVIICKYI
ncbi:MAG: hypothetical protein LBQ68_01395 [Clostridiales bacterium]|nr:hypothetical protein [Clostridiales bacterium]